MNSLRVKFNRGEQVKFISHLDLMKTFERAIRRSGLPIAYSQGFNPHPHMVFGLPLSVGVTSEAEYADFETTEEVPPEEFISRLNEELPAGLKLTAARPKKSGGNIMASISGALYEITLILREEMSREELDGRLAGYLGRSSVIARKEGKNGARDIDIRPMIRKLEAEAADIPSPGYEEYKTAFTVKALLDAGSVSNVKPELVAASFAELEKLGAYAARIHRKELFVGKNGRLAGPFDEE